MTDTPQEGQLMERRPDGTFQKGKSGNPLGRPKGSKNQITLLKQSLELQLREQAEPEMAAVLQMAIELAKQGDKQMIKLLLDAHLSKGINEDAKAADRVAIQINAAPPQEQKKVENVNVIEIPQENDSHEQHEAV